MGIELMVGAIVISIFLLWIIALLKVRVKTFTAPSLKELEKQINTFTESLLYMNIQDITIRNEEDQYYGYVRWRGFSSSK